MPSSTRPQATPRILARHATPAERSRSIARAGQRARSSSAPSQAQHEPWPARLRRALAEDLFVLHYQPIVSLPDRELAHHEALVRLADVPGGRLVAPGAFLPAAERHGLICALDRLVLEKAVARLAGEATGRSTRVAVNLSALSVTDEGMLAHVTRLLARWGVDPSRLVIELTETSAIPDMGRARSFCAGAEALGCAIALDDFGAGFGSLQYLKHLPFRYLKIDGSFIRGVTTSKTDQLVVGALVELATGMGRETIAEFVGDLATLETVTGLGVDYAQGYEIGRPVADLGLAPNGPSGAVPR